MWMSRGLFPLVRACSHRARSRGYGVSSGRDTCSGDGFSFLGHPASASANTVDSAGASFTALYRITPDQGVCFVAKEGRPMVLCSWGLSVLTKYMTTQKTLPGGTMGWSLKTHLDVTLRGWSSSLQDAVSD